MRTFGRRKKRWFASKSLIRSLKKVFRVGLVVVLLLAADYSYRRWKAHEVAKAEGFELSLVSVNLAYHLANGSGRMNSTYMDEQNESMSVCFPEFGRNYQVDGLGKKNCYPQQEGRHRIHTVFPFWAFRSKEKVNIRGRYYSSYLVGNGKTFYVDKNVLFDEEGYLYATASHFERRMYRSCPETGGWLE